MKYNTWQQQQNQAPAEKKGRRKWEASKER